MIHKKSIIIERELEFRRKLDNLLKDLSDSFGFPLGRLREGFKENYSLILNSSKQLPPSEFNILALSEILKSCHSRDTMYFFDGKKISNEERAESYLYYRKHGFSDEEIYTYSPTIVIDDDSFRLLHCEKLYIPYQPSIESDAFDVNVILFSYEIGRTILRYDILPISVPKNEITSISDCYDYFSRFPNPNEADFWMNLYSLERYRNLFLDGEDKSDKILLKYEFSSYPLEDSKKYIC